MSFEEFSQWRLCANDIHFCLSPSAKWPQSTVSSLMFASNLSSLCFSLQTILKLIKLTLLQRPRCAVVSIGECPLISSMIWHVQCMLSHPCRSIVSKLIAFQLFSRREILEREDYTIAVKNQTQTHNTVNTWHIQYRLLEPNRLILKYFSSISQHCLGKLLGQKYDRFHLHLQHSALCMPASGSSYTLTVKMFLCFVA